MAHKIGLNDTQYEPDIRGAVDFCFFNDVQRIKSDVNSVNTVINRRKGIDKKKSVKQPFLLVSSTQHPSSLLFSSHHKQSSLIESSLDLTKRHSSSLVGPKQSGLSEDTFFELKVEKEDLGQQDENSDSDRSSSNKRPTRSSTKSGGSPRRRREQNHQSSEGHQGSAKVMRADHISSFVSSGSEQGSIGSTSSFEAHQEPRDLHFEESRGSAVMEQVDLQQNPSLLYSSDEWEESEFSDTDSDHSDSSDDDDPKSQVDRLIERGTLIYMDGENSNVSSETESSDSSDYDDSDSESDITDVSPLLSATASPLGLSPVLPRRTLGTSPLALHDNRDLVADYYRPEILSNDQGYDSQPHCNGSSHSNSDDSTDMTLLLKAVVELEKKQKRNQQDNYPNRPSNDHYNTRHYPHHHHKNKRNSRNHHHRNHQHSHQNNPHHTDTSHYSKRNHNITTGTTTTSPMPIRAIDASPHHSHLRKISNRRKNMSFSNDEVRRIDRENQILLHKIMSAHDAKSQSSSNNHNTRSVHRPANATVNRRREDEKIRRENMILLRKIQEAKPSRDVTASRSPRYRTAHSVRPPSSLPTTPGASARTA